LTMCGVINVLKPPGMSSHDVVDLVRSMTGQRRVGHTGTLDPAVAGVLPVCVGRATRLAEYLLELPKTYRAEMTIGVSTDTDDWTGRVLETRDAHGIGAPELETVLRSFVGPYRQVPPMFSAVHYDGRRLYELAREGRRVEREPRVVNVYAADLVYMDDGPPPRAVFDVVCSKGTYVRTLCADVGKQLGPGAHLSYLVRTRAGPFELSDALTVEELGHLAARGRLPEVIVSPADALSHLPAIHVEGDAAARLRHGTQPWQLGGLRPPDDAGPGDVVRALDPSGGLVAVMEVEAADPSRPRLITRKVFD